MSPDSQNHQPQQALRRIDELITSLYAASGSPAAAPTYELMELIVSIHAQGLARMLEIIARTEGGETLIKRLTMENRISSLLSLHNLHPQNLEDRVRATMKSLRPQLEVMGIGVVSVNIDNGIAKLTLREVGAGGRQQSLSAQTLQSKLEENIFNAAPGLAGIDIQGLPAPKAYVPVSSQGKPRPGVAANG